MLSKVINCQSFCKAICKYISTIYSFNGELIICYQFMYIMMLDIDIFSMSLNLYILDKDDACLIIST